MGNKAIRGIHRLTPIEVRAAKDDCNDGGGLLLRVGADGRAAWALRFTSATGKRREMGLGVCHRQSQVLAGESLIQARKLAAEARALLSSGIDPVDDRDAKRAEKLTAEAQAKQQATMHREVEHWTLARCARDYHERIIEPKLTRKHAAQWIASLENHIPAGLWHAPIVTITAPALVAALLKMKPHARARNKGGGDRMGETRSRVLQRLAAVWDDAIFHERATANPAGSATRRKIAEGAPKRRRGAHRALPYGEAPAAMQAIGAAEGAGARALEFAVLTAARTNEVLGARWCEIDADAKLWRIPAQRMKARRPHDVPLSARALAVLERMRGLDDELIFPGAIDKHGKAAELSNMAMLAVLSRLGLRERTTVHGLARATFSTWANERGIARPDVIEAALAHAEGDKTRAAYNRANFDDERRALLEAWAAYLGREAAPVVELRAA
jgi:integrase